MDAKRVEARDARGLGRSSVGKGRTSMFTVERRFGDNRMVLVEFWVRSDDWCAVDN